MGLLVHCEVQAVQLFYDKCWSHLLICIHTN